MTELVKCDSCGVDTPQTGWCRVEGLTDSNGVWHSGSFNVAVGLCERCDDAWSESITPVNFDRMAWINDRVNEAHSLAGGHALARAICAIVDEFAELLSVHYAGGE